MKSRLNQSVLIFAVFVLVGCAVDRDVDQPIFKPVQRPALHDSRLPKFRTDAPERYVVRRGDTLWGIARRFLNSPARWKSIWYANPQIKNPNRIYPGDVISYITIGGQRKLYIAGSSGPNRGKRTGRKTRDGRPIYRVSPKTQVTALAEPIPTIPKDAVYAFMSKNLILGAQGLSNKYPYVVAQSEGDYLSLTGKREIFVKGNRFDYELYDVYREAGQIKNPADNSIIGVEAIYVGQLKMAADPNEDGIATFVQTRSTNPLMPMDVLVPTPVAREGGDLYFMPQLPRFDDTLVVVKPIGTQSNSIGTQFSTLLINGGRDNGVEEGMVYKIVRAANQTTKGRDGKTLRLPEYGIGHALVYRTFDEASYVLVMDATDVIRTGDRLISP